METMRKYYAFSFAFTAVCFALAAWYGWASTGSITATLGILWIVLVLSILEVSLSFDNAVVNATVLRDMDPVWQQRFLTIGILIAVFGMRIVFPIAIVAIAAKVGPLEAVSLSLNNPAEYERIVSDAHIGIAGFGAACAAAAQDLADGVWERVAELRNVLEKALEAASKKTIFVGKDVARLPNTSCFITPGWRGETQVMQMDLAGFAISAGAACSSGKVATSRVLTAMGFDDAEASCAVRVSLGPDTTEEQVLRFADAWTAKLKKHEARAA